MTKKEAYKVGEVIAALRKGNGYVSQAASALGCSSQTVYNYAERHPTIRAEWDDIREARHDFVENALHKNIKDGNVTAQIFYLKTQARHRGYVERQEVTGADGGDLGITVYVPDNKRD